MNAKLDETLAQAGYDWSIPALVQTLDTRIVIHDAPGGRESQHTRRRSRSPSAISHSMEG
ncbi:MAG: hypothetical protein ACRCWS_06975 [Propionibacteriaceae bacterium]